MMSKKREEPTATEGICQNCLLEFSLFDDAVRVVSGPTRGVCLIIDDLGRAHTILIGRTRDDVKRQIEQEEHSWSDAKSYQEARKEDEESQDDDAPTQESQFVAMDDVAGLDQIIGEQAQ